MTGLALHTCESNGRQNNFGVLRLIAALLVLLSHSWPLAGRNDEWLEGKFGFSFGSLAVATFFIMSGYLVCGSYKRDPKVLAFLWRRAIRIFPALIVAVLLSAICAYASSKLGFLDFFGGADFRSYVRHNIVLLGGIQFTLYDAFALNPYPNSVNGSLWTLPYELRMYLVCALAGWLGFLGSRALYNLAYVCMLIVFSFWPASENQQLPFLGLSFASGVFFAVNSEHVILSRRGCLIALAVMVCTHMNYFADAIFYPALAYCIFWAAYRLPPLASHFFDKNDYSYGVYLYAFPVQQLTALWLVRLDILSVPSMFIFSLIPTLMLACLSWIWIESPAMKWKTLPRFRIPAGVKPGHAG